MIERSRPIVLMAALLATSALTAPSRAEAQEYFPPAVPPIRETVDANGVDLTRGTVVSRGHGVSIGGAGNQGLGWSRSVTSTGGFRDSTAAVISVSGSAYTVSIGSHSENFTLSGGNYISVEKTGATLAGSPLTYTSANGTIYTFGSWGGGVTKRQYSGTYRVSSITLPTGEVMTYNWQTATGICIPKPGDPCSLETSASRLSSVTATNGYQLKFDFQLVDDPAQISETKAWMTIAKVTALNMSVDYCAPVADTCTFSQSWPSLTLAGVTQFTDSLNRTTTYTYTGGQMTGIKRPGASANSTTYAYTSGKVSQVVSEGVTTNYGYADVSGVRTTTIGDAITGDRLVRTDLATMLVTSDTNEAGKVTAYEYYPASGLLKKVTAPEGNIAEYEYDARGNHTKTTSTPKPGSPLSPIITQSSFPPSDVTQTWRCATGTPAVVCNKPLTTTDARGFVTNYAWDQTHGGPASVTLPAPAGGAVRPETRYSYSSFTGQYKNSGGTLVNFATPVTRLTGVSACQTLATCAGAADEVKSTIAYGTTNVLPTSVASGSGDGTLTATSAFTYDTIGNRLTVDGPLPGTADTSRTRYDAVRQVIGQIGPDPDAAGTLKHRARRMTYNLDGQATKVEAGTVNSQSDPDWANFVSLEAVETGYDTNARPVTSKLTSGATTYALTQSSYDSIGRLDCQAVRMNSATFDSPPASACTLGTQGSAGPDRISKMTYDAVSRPTKVTVAFGTADAADEVTATYSDNGAVTTVKDAENNLTTYLLDGFDRVSRQRYPLPTQGSNASSTTDYDELTHDAASNVTSRRLRDATSIAYTYDNLNRPTLKNLPGTEPDVTYAYDNLSRLTSATQTGSSLSFTYDALSRNLTQAGPQGTVASQWDLAGRRTKLTYPGAGLFVDQDYLVTGETTKLRENGAVSGVGVLATYSYDDLGRRTSLTFGNGASQAYTFDPVSRLASLTNNLSGTTNDLSATLAYNPASQIASTIRTGDAYAWTGHFNQNATGTANGLNQLTQVGTKALTHDTRGNVTAFGTRSFTYSSENMLLTAPNATTLSYDPAMRLAQTVTGATTQRFAYDGLDRIAEYDAANALQRRYVHGPATDEPIVWYEGSSTSDRRFLGSDERGSVISVTDSAGTVLGLNRYDEYGNPQSTNIGAFGYTGQAWIAGANLWHYKARAYDPELGRFLQTDPIGYDGGMNLYAYVGNDPVNWVDPLGLAICNTGVFVYTGSFGYTESDGTGVVRAQGYCASGGPSGPVDWRERRLPGEGRGKGTAPLGRGARGLSPQYICDTPLQGGGTIRQNVATIQLMLEGEIASAGWSNTERASAGWSTIVAWVFKVSPVGSWAGRLGEPWGNWNYGATGRAAGLSLQTVLRGAGLAEQLEGLTGTTGSGAAGQGSPFGNAPYGDNPWSQEEIAEGYNARCR